MRNRWFFLGLALLALCLFVPQKSFAQSTISCNSDDRNRHTCAVDTRGGVTLATQHSNSACTQGYSWGYDNQGIWVDHGCRADFTVGSSRDYQRGRNGQYGRNGQDDRDRQNNGYGQTQTITCSSNDMRRHSCAVDTRGGVTLARQLSNAACTQGHSWGYDNRRIWVDHGCRADFTVGSSRDYQRGRNGQYGRNGQDDRDRQNNGYGQTQTISCSSDDMRRHSCAVDTRGGVTLARQLSNAACTQGYSWGYDNQGIWVDHGCRADFSVSVRDNTDNQR
jgi:hypothetical protein